jgi:hypothetical protein
MNEDDLKRRVEADLVQEVYAARIRFQHDRQREFDNYDRAVRRLADFLLRGVLPAKYRLKSVPHNWPPMAA